MNTKLKIFTILLILAMVCVVTACDGQKAHEHEYSSEWTYNTEQHWHSSTCDGIDGCQGSASDVADHNIIDGICSVCGYSIPTSDGGAGGEDNGTEGGDNTEGGNNDNPGEGDNTGSGGNDNPGEGDNTGSGGNDDGNDNPGGEDNKPTVCSHEYTCQQTKEPTCTAQGENSYTCSLCGDSYTETVDAKGHTEQPLPGKAPTCTETGLSSGNECSVCGEVTVAQSVIGALGHNYNEGICSNCGEVDPNYNSPAPKIIHTATTANYCWVDKVSFTASESGEYTFRLPAGLGAWDADDHASGKPGPAVDSLHPNYVAKESDFTVKIAAGSTYEFYIAAVTVQNWTINWSFVACEVEEDDDSIPATSLVLGTNSFGAETIVYSYTAPAVGNLTLTSGIQISGKVEISYTVNGGDPVNLAMQSSAILNLAQGDEVLITVLAVGYSDIKAEWHGDGDVEEDPFIDFSGEYIGTDAFGNQLLTVVIDSNAATVVFKYYHPLTGPNDVYATYKVSGGEVILYDESGKLLHPLSGTLVLTDGVPTSASFDGTEYLLSLGEPDDDGGEIIDGEIVIKGEMIDFQENTFTVTKSDILMDKMYVTFVPVYDGEYDFLSNHIFVQKLTTEDGVRAEKNEYDYFILKSYVTYIVEINLEYIAHAGDYTVTPTYKYPAGHSKNPMWYTVGETATATYNADYHPVWHQFYADVTGTLTVTTHTPGVTVMIAAIPNFDISATESVSLDVVQGRKYYIGVAAYDSTEPIDIIFSASIVEGEITTDGSINMPHIFVDGDNLVEAEPSEGMYFLYKSTSNGILTLSSQSEGFSWCFTDFTEPIAPVCGDISIHLSLGDSVYLYVKADANISAPIAFNAGFANDAKQVWFAGPFVLDGSAPNSFILEEDNSYGLFRISGTVGSFVISWDNPDAIVTVGGASLTSGGMINISDPWFGPGILVFFDGYKAGAVNLTITQVA